jgi:hypothetical protein
MNSLKFPIAAAAAVTATVMSTAPAYADDVVVEHRTADVQVSQTQPNSAMLSSGIVGVAVPYLASVVVGAESNHPGDRNLFVPVAGPWMDLGDRHCQVGESCNHEGLYKGLLIADGIFQGLGALEIVGAFLFPETITARTASHGTPTRTAGVHIAPTGVGSGYGLAAIGAF